MPEIIKTKWKPSKKTIAQFGPGNGKLQLLLDEYPNFIYQQRGSYFYATDGDFISVYEWEPGTTDGFAGREMVLNMTDGTQKKFNGSLWIPSCIVNPSRTTSQGIPRFCSVSITTKPDVIEHGRTFYSSGLSIARYIALRSSLGVSVSMNEIEQPRWRARGM